MLMDGALTAAGTSAAKVGFDKLGQVGVLYDGLAILGGGAILGGLVLGAMTAFIVDRDFTKAAAFAGVGAALTFFGFMHGEAIGIARTPLVAVSYLLVAGWLYGCAKYATARKPAPMPEMHAAVPAD
jgi:AGZA family xanthine/uracil permease-like MFS transporter